MTRHRGITPVKHAGQDYCPNCGMWGSIVLCKTYLSNEYWIYSFLHTEYIEGYQFRRRCYVKNLEGFIQP